MKSISKNLQSQIIFAIDVYGDQDLKKYIPALFTNIQMRLRGKTLLHLAAERGYTGLADVLINAGIPVDSIDNAQNTPLIMASFYGHYECVKLLLDQGANINAVDRDNFSPLMSATLMNQEEVFDLLVERGCDGKQCAWHNINAMSVAKTKGHNSLIKKLEDLYTMKNDNKETSVEPEGLSW